MADTFQLSTEALGNLNNSKLETPLIRNDNTKKKGLVYWERKEETLHRLLKPVLGFLRSYFYGADIKQLEENGHPGDSQNSFGSLN